MVKIKLGSQFQKKIGKYSLKSIYIYVCVCVYVCVCIYIYTHSLIKISLVSTLEKQMKQNIEDPIVKN